MTRRKISDRHLLCRAVRQVEQEEVLKQIYNNK